MHLYQATDDIQTASRLKQITLFQERNVRIRIRILPVAYSKALRSLWVRGKVFRIGTVRYNWPMSAHASQVFSIAHCTDSEDLPARAQ